MEKIIIMTGVTGAIGKATALDLAKNKNVRLILIGRDGAKLNDLSKTLQRGGAQVETHEADLAQPDAVKRVVDRIASAHKKLDGLVNIAAVYKGTKTLTRSGRETMFAINHLG